MKRKSKSIGKRTINGYNKYIIIMVSRAVLISVVLLILYVVLLILYSWEYYYWVHYNYITIFYAINMMDVYSAQTALFYSPDLMPFYSPDLMPKLCYIHRIFI